MEGRIAGFDWDDGNIAKCHKHSVSQDEIESLFLRPLLILPDQAHSLTETRLKAIGKTTAGRYIFLVFTIRQKQEKRYIRPISARYMHKKEMERFEKENPNL